MKVSGRRPPKWLQVSKAVEPELYGCISEEMRKAGDEKVRCVHRIEQRVDWATRLGSVMQDKDEFLSNVIHVFVWIWMQHGQCCASCACEG